MIDVFIACCLVHVRHLGTYDGKSTAARDLLQHILRQITSARVVDLDYKSTLPAIVRDLLICRFQFGYRTFRLLRQRDRIHLVLLQNKCREDRNDHEEEPETLVSKQ